MAEFTIGDDFSLTDIKNDVSIFRQKIKDSIREAEFEALVRDQPDALYRFLEDVYYESINTTQPGPFRLGQAEISDRDYIEDLGDTSVSFNDNLPDFIRQEMDDPQRLGSDVTGAPKYFPGSHMLGRQQSGSIMEGDYDSYQEFLIRKKPKEGERTYQSGHWPGKKNVIAHMRTTYRRDSDRNDVFMIEELQSDWGQTVSENLDEAINEKYENLEGKFERYYDSEKGREVGFLTLLIILETFLKAP